jgi:hypothetical protein
MQKIDVDMTPQNVVLGMVRSEKSMKRRYWEQNLPNEEEEIENFCCIEKGLKTRRGE